jgi:hypothetical protein
MFVARTGVAKEIRIEASQSKKMGGFIIVSTDHTNFDIFIVCSLQFFALTAGLLKLSNSTTKFQHTTANPWVGLPRLTDNSAEDIHLAQKKDFTKRRTVFPSKSDVVNFSDGFDDFG